MLLTPLEQFQIIAILPFNILFFDLSFTNLFLINLLTIIFINFSYKFVTKHHTFFFVPGKWQVIFEMIVEITMFLAYDSLKKKNGEIYFPFIATLFIFILLLNIIGLIPYSFTTTSHLIITFIVSLSVFVGVNLVCIKTHKTNIFSLFIPSNCSVSLALLLVPVEFVSYIFRPISLGVRLFANLMAGHTLLKVVIGFSWSLLLLKNLISLICFIPLFIVVLLFFLELGVALIQAYVFVVLTCIYLNENIILH